MGNKDVPVLGGPGTSPADAGFIPHPTDRSPNPCRDERAGITSGYGKTLGGSDRCDVAIKTPIGSPSGTTAVPQRALIRTRFLLGIPVAVASPVSRLVTAHLPPEMTIHCSTFRYGFPPTGAIRVIS